MSIPTSTRLKEIRYEIRGALGHYHLNDVGHVLRRMVAGYVPRADSAP